MVLSRLIHIALVAFLTCHATTIAQAQDTTPIEQACPLQCDNVVQDYVAGTASGYCESDCFHVAYSISEDDDSAVEKHASVIIDGLASNETLPVKFLDGLELLNFSFGGDVKDDLFLVDTGFCQYGSYYKVAHNLHDVIGEKKSGEYVIDGYRCFVNSWWGRRLTYPFPPLSTVDFIPKFDPTSSEMSEFARALIRLHVSVN